MRDQLIAAGIAELAAHGLSNFSLRRVANACGASCAAPYRHFKNREALLAAMVDYINGQWGLFAENIIRAFVDDKRTCLIEVCVAFIRFLFANDNYRSVLSASGEHLLSGEDKLPSLLKEYAATVGMDDTSATRVLYTMRALVYGTVAMLANGELTNTADTFEMVRQALAKELC